MHTVMTYICPASVFLIMLSRVEISETATSLTPSPVEILWLEYCENSTVQSRETCRTRHGHLYRHDYSLCTCVECYVYLFQKQFPSTEFPDPDVQNSMDTVCNSLTEEECSRWKSCCHDANACCLSIQGEKEVRGACPATWDGFSCVQSSQPNTTVHFSCPSFMGTSKQQAVKTCTDVGVWWREPLYSKEWTNYSACVQVDLPGERAVQIVGIVCNSVSIVFLVTAIAVFTGFSQLRYHRHVKLHVNLCVSLVLTGVTSLLMEKLVYYDGLKLEDPERRFQIAHQTVCKVLNILDLLFQMCPAFWMLCEGFYLTWLMLRAFQHLSSIAGFYVFGWGAPSLIIIIFICLVTQLEPSVCWLTDSTGILWLVYVPTIACIAINLVFFLVILVVMLTQLQTHPREPSNFRRVLKAMVILIPLFGIQQFCIMYSPSSSVPGFLVYNIARKIIIHSQGLLVALIFCFCNSEVHTQVSSALKRWRRGHRSGYRRRTSTTTASTLTLHRPSLPDLGISHIALSNLESTSSPLRDQPDPTVSSMGEDDKNLF